MPVEEIIEKELGEVLEQLGDSDKVLINVRFRLPEELQRSDCQRVMPQNVLKANRTLKESYALEIQYDLDELNIGIKISSQLFFCSGLLTKGDIYKLSERPYVAEISRDVKTIAAVKS